MLDSGNQVDAFLSSVGSARERTRALRAAIGVKREAAVPGQDAADPPPIGERAPPAGKVGGETVNAVDAPSVALVKPGRTFIVTGVGGVVAKVVAGHAVVHSDLALGCIKRVSPGVGTLKLEAAAEPS